MIYLGHRTRLEMEYGDRYGEYPMFSIGYPNPKISNHPFRYIVDFAVFPENIGEIRLSLAEHVNIELQAVLDGLK